MKKQTVLITGASGGLGEEFARIFAADGFDLVLVARTEEKLRFLENALKTKHGISVSVVPSDLSQNDAAKKLVAALDTKGITVDILVNNAGFGAFGAFTETDAGKEQEMIALNVTTLTQLSKLLLPRMVQRKSGKILNVASTAAFQPGPLMAVYYATKAYVMNFSLALSEEVRGTGVVISCLCPGPTKTGFQAHAGMMKSRLFRFGVMDARRAALVGYNGLMHGKPLVIPGLTNTIGAFMTRFISRSLAGRIAKMAQAPEKESIA